MSSDVVACNNTKESRTLIRPLYRYAWKSIIVASQYDRARFVEALRQVKIASRGSKPNAALRELGVPSTITAP
jgi:hypothetical protein